MSDFLEKVMAEIPEDSTDIETAIRIAKLWRQGKMIGYGEDGEERVRNALLDEVERLRALNRTAVDE